MDIASSPEVGVTEWRPFSWTVTKVLLAALGLVVLLGFELGSQNTRGDDVDYGAIVGSPANVGRLLLCAAGLGIGMHWALRRRLPYASTQPVPNWQLRAGLGVFARAQASELALGSVLIALTVVAAASGMNELHLGNLIVLFSKVGACTILLALSARHLVPGADRLPRSMGIPATGSEPIPTIGWTLMLFTLTQLFDFVLFSAGSLRPIGQMAPIEASNPLAIGAMLLEGIVVTPVLEELSFRWILYGALRTIVGPFWSAIISAFTFSFFHGDVSTISGNFVFGFIMAIGYERSRSMVPLFLCHALTNAWAYSEVLSTSGIVSQP